MAEGGRGRLLGMGVGVEEGPAVELGVEGCCAIWVCVGAWWCCSCWGCRLPETLGGGVVPRVGWPVGPEGSWEPWEPIALSGRLEFCGCWNKMGHIISEPL